MTNVLEQTRLRLVKYLNRVGVAMSVLFNVLTGGASNQTFSARNWQWKKDKKYNLVWLIDLVIGKGHCAECWVYWKVREGKW
jgi:hypothetical protein